jgi:hypothetical protein
MATATRKATCGELLISGPRAGEPCGSGAVTGTNPPRCRRHADENGQNRQQKKELALAAYAETGIVGTACAVAGIGRATFYEWLDSDIAFATSALSAAEEAADMLEAEATRRAVVGVESTLYDRKGEPIGTETKYSDTLLIFLLKARRPARFRERFDAKLTVDTGIPDATPEVQTDDRIGHLMKSMQTYQQRAIEATSRDSTGPVVDPS